MNRKQNLEVFAKTPVRKAVLLQIVPAVASQMVTLVYNLADTYFVGMLNAPHETAAVTVAYPSFLMLTAISNLFGVGGASAIARALGRQDEEGARRIAAVSLAGGLLSALLFSAAFRLLADPVLHLCGATEATYAAAYGYAKWVVILGGPFTILNTLLANLVRAEGGAGAAAFGVSFGGVLNILLDPVLIFGFGMGTAGAGVATALSQGVSFCILLFMFLRGKTVSRFRLGAITRSGSEFGQILLGGLPSFGRQGLNSIGGMLLNIAARSYGDAAVAGMSIVSRIFSFMLSVALGVGQGFQPVASFNYGARKYHRVRHACLFTIQASFYLMSVLILLCWFNAGPLIRLFRDDPAVTAVALPAFRYQCLAMFLQPVMVASNMLFQSIGKAGRATFLSCCRQGIFFLPLILLLPQVWGLVGIEVCQPIADVLTFCVSVPFLLSFLRELERMEQAQQNKA